MSEESTPSDGAPVLEVRDVEKRFGGLVAVDGASFGIARGSITGIVGPNGAGKSTLFDLVTGLHEPDGGEILLDGESLVGLSPPRRIAAGLGRTFQTPRIFEGMTVEENLRFAAMGQAGEAVGNVLFRADAVAQEELRVAERAREILAFLDLDHLADTYARGLSGGQRKLLELGRVLMLEPDVLLLDEPAAGVNPTLANRIVDRLHAINDRGTTIAIIEHDMGLIMEHCEQVVVLHNGATLATGEPAVIREDERVLDVYLTGGAP